MTHRRETQQKLPTLGHSGSAAIQVRNDKPSSLRRQQRPVVVVGCDFGTHSTKVLYQRRGDEKLHLATTADPCPGYPACATPSVLRVTGNRLHFGREAVLQPDGELLASLKVDLLRSPADRPTQNSRDPEVLVAAYLTWIFTRIRRRIAGEYSEANALIQVAAPIDYKGFLDHSEIKQRFQRVVQAAWRSAFESRGQGVDWLQDSVPYGPACTILGELLKEPLIDESEARFQVLPETVAPVVSLALDPEMEPGIYLMVDVGAGTTEMSVVLATRNRNGEVATCYFDSTIEVGGNLLANADAAGDRKLAGELVRQLDSQARLVHHTSYRKDMGNRAAREKWKDLTVILAGGGTQRDDVARAFRDHTDTPWSSYLTSFRVQQFILDGPRISLDTDSLGVAREEARYLVVARGLLVERAQWPFTYLPADVAPLPRDEVAERSHQHWDDK